MSDPAHRDPLLFLRQFPPTVDPLDPSVLEATADVIVSVAAATGDPDHGLSYVRKMLERGRARRRGRPQLNASTRDMILQARFDELARTIRRYGRYGEPNFRAIAQIIFAEGDGCGLGVDSIEDALHRLDRRKKIGKLRSRSGVDLKL